MVMVATPTHGNARAKPASLPASAGTLNNQPQFANPYLQNGYRDW